MGENLTTVHLGVSVFKKSPQIYFSRYLDGETHICTSRHSRMYILKEIEDNLCINYTKSSPTSTHCHNLLCQRDKYWDWALLNEHNWCIDWLWTYPVSNIWHSSSVLAQKCTLICNLDLAVKSKVAVANFLSLESRRPKLARITWQRSVFSHCFCCILPLECGRGSFGFRFVD